MSRSVAILGSTGSIGKTLLSILKSNKKKINIKLLTAYKNYNLLMEQANNFNVKNIIITDKQAFKKAMKINKNSKLKIHNDYKIFKEIFKKRIDYSMSAITGLDGLLPTYKIIKHTKKIAIANKESIVCAWNILDKELKKYNTKFIPVDSEHFSTWYAINNNKTSNIENLYLTASGGAVFNYKLSMFKFLKKSKILKHPNWNMGDKITVDSSTMMNKVFEILEARNIFKIDLTKIKILIHPSSYIHAIIKFNDGMTKIIAHDTTMTIPIFNTLEQKYLFRLKSSPINLKKLNSLELQEVNYKKYPIIKILDIFKFESSCLETILVSINDELVNLFLKNKISFNDISKFLFKLIRLKDFDKFRHRSPNKIDDILYLSEYARLKTRLYCV